ncbi:hypothetical protein HK098_003961 [Nowakowskiella sp. JEL0407]|nr:hypothetical protein HK098_003961 [Nowakowskiella sp. JEL0407]
MMISEIPPFQMSPEIPREILFEICDYLKTKDIIRFSSSSRNLRSSLRPLIYATLKIDQHDGDEISTPESTSMMRENCHFKYEDITQHQQISEYIRLFTHTLQLDCGQNREFLSNSLSLICFENLKELSFCNLPFSLYLVLGNFLQRFTTLEALEFIDSGQLSDQERFSDAELQKLQDAVSSLKLLRSFAFSFDVECPSGVIMQNCLLAGLCGIQKWDRFCVVVYNGTAEGVCKVLASTSIGSLELSILDEHTENCFHTVRIIAKGLRACRKLNEVSILFEMMLDNNEMLQMNEDLIDSLLPNEFRKLDLKRLKLWRQMTSSIRFFRKVQKLGLEYFDLCPALRFDSKEEFITFCSILAAFTSLKSFREITIFPGCVETFLSSIAKLTIERLTINLAKVDPDEMKAVNNLPANNLRKITINFEPLTKLQLDGLFNAITHHPALQKVSICTMCECLEYCTECKLALHRCIDLIIALCKHPQSLVTKITIEHVPSEWVYTLACKLLQVETAIVSNIFPVEDEDGVTFIRIMRPRQCDIRVSYIVVDDMTIEEISNAIQMLKSRRDNLL